MTWNLPRRMHQTLGIRGWVGIAAVVAVLTSAPFVWRSRFVTDRRATSSRDRAHAHIKAGELDAARADLRAVLRLRPFDAGARVALANLELGAGNWELAFLEYQALTELHPEEPQGWVGLASILIRGGLLVTPEEALDTAIAAAPGRADAHVLRADLRSRMGRFHGARLDAQAAVEAEQKDSVAWALLVRTTARSKGRPAGIDAADRGLAAVGKDPALVRLREWLASERGPADAPGVAGELGPAPAPSQRVRVEVERAADKLASLAQEHWPGRLAETRQALEAQLRRQDWSGARATVESAQRTWPGSAFAAFLGGIVELARGNTADAERQLSDALALAPRSPVIATALAKAWSRERGAAYAGEELVRLGERDPGFAFARLMAARAYMDGRDPVRAESALRRGIELQPDSAASYRALADHDLALDRAADAVSVCQQGLERLPRNAELELLLARIDADLGRTDDAVRILEGVLTHSPDLDLVEYKLGALLAGEDAPPPRLHEVLRHLGSDLPSDPALLAVLGWMHYRSGNTSRGRDLLQASVKAAPDAPGAHYHLAAVYTREKKADLARSELQAAVDSKRPFPERMEAMRLLRDSASAPASRRPTEAAR